MPTNYEKLIRRVNRWMISTRRRRCCPGIAVQSTSRRRAGAHRPNDHHE